jgi:hypothetical protein
MQLNRASVRGFLVLTKIEMEWQHTMSLLLISIALAPVCEEPYNGNPFVKPLRIETSMTLQCYLLKNILKFQVPNFFN